MRVPSNLLALGLAVLATVALGACATIPEPDVLTSQQPAQFAQGSSPQASEANEFESLVATAKDAEIDIWDAPGGRVVTTVDASEVLTAPDATPLVFLVSKQQVDWYEVYLPIRPNGATGWVPSSAVTIATTDFALEVYLASHELVVAQAGEELARFPIAVGASDMPTPGGVYFLRELLQPPDPNDVYGVYAYGLSGYSPVLDSFRGGDAVIGLHGTNDPASIGTNVSHGCLRMFNEDITRLVTEFQLPLGTPVHIHE